MTRPIILASGSETRQAMLRQAGVDFTSKLARIDEDSIKASLLAEDAPPRDVADALAEFKARRVAQQHPEALVIGSDQVLEVGGAILSKPVTAEDAIAQLSQMSGKQHKLLSAVVIYEDAKPVWRTVGQVRLTVRILSPDYIESYVARNWEDIRHCVGGYQIEAEGARLFARVDGDYFTVLGMPLLDVLGYLTMSGAIDG
ncbi:Maf family protein [Litoreibacter albidus]|uniref:Nucleoside triphosphate pyrophosphatase n=1 Tax=Litoreibacter albidus TaxID=670155 RepID=A0A1H2WDV8_9RHOB|nr:Maf family nucleotide pyrophosphatase [Litoreibacter albidus]SDW78454.1 septum formation protein [Litoreibacter albidus]